MNGEMGTVEYVSMLYDFYGALLSDSRREVTALYHEDNLSLSEIAEELGMTRQAVHYTLKKAETALQDYEARLGLVASYERNQRLADEALALTDRLYTAATGRDDASAGAAGADELRDRLIKIIGKLAE